MQPPTDAAPRITPRRRILGLFAPAYGLAAAAALLSWYALGDVWWLQPVNVTTFWWSLPAVPLLLVAILARRRRAVIGLILPAAIFIWSYGGAWLPTPTPSGVADVRVATYNTYVHAEGAGHVLALVERHAPDVLLLQEVFDERAAGLSAELGDRLPHRWFGESGGVGGVAVLSRYPIIDVRPVPRATEHARPTAIVTIDVGGRQVQVVAVHLTSPCLSCGPSVPGRLGAESRARAREVAEVVAQLDPSLPTVLAGDLNSNDRSVAYRDLVDAGFADPLAEVRKGPGFTWPAERPWVRVDWILNRGFIAIDTWVDDAQASDHRAVIADLAFAN